MTVRRDVDLARLVRVSRVLSVDVGEASLTLPDRAGLIHEFGEAQ